MLAALTLLIALWAMPDASAVTRVIDDAGNTLALPRPASRIISLAPHITESLFAAGAGERIVGTVRYSNYPDAAKSIPQVGDSALLDIERIVSLRPDVIVAWLHGNAEGHLAALRTLGIPIFYAEPKRLADIPASLLRFGEMAGTEPVARAAAARFEAKLSDLQRRYAGRPPVRIFFQVWSKPLLTINGRQIISDVIRLCGGINVFADAATLVPAVDMEAVANADPEAIVASRGDDVADDGLDVWRKLPSMRAVRSDNLIVVNEESLGRHSPRVLEAADRLCDALEAVRAKRRP